MMKLCVSISLLLATAVSMGQSPATQPATRPAATRPAEAVEDEAALAARLATDGVLLEQLISRGLLDDALAAYRRRPVHDKLISLGEALKRSGRGLEMLEFYNGFLLGPAENNAASRSYSNGLGTAVEVIHAVIAVEGGPQTEKLLSAAAAKRPGEAHLHLRLGYLRWRMGKHPQALEEFDKFLAANPTASVGRLAWIAGLCKREGLMDKALAYYGRALDTPVTDDDVRARSMMSSRARDPGDIRSELRADLLTSSGEIHCARKKWADAEKCYKQVLDIRPQVSQRYVESVCAALSRVWKAMGKDNPLVKEMKDGIEADPGNADLHARLGRLLLAFGQRQDGIDHYRQAAMLDPLKPTYRLALADALVKAGLNVEALAEYTTVLRAAVQTDPGRLVREVVTPETVLSGIRRLDSPMTPAPTSPPPDLRDRLFKLYGEVLDMHPPATAWSPSDYTVRDLVRRMAAILEGKSNYAAVVDLWLNNRARIGMSACDEVMRHFGRLESLKGVIDRLRQETKGNKGDISGMFILGDALVAAGRSDEALKTYTELSESHPNDTRVHLDLAGRYSKMSGQGQRVLAEYQAVLAQLPAGGEEHTSVLGALARANLRMGNKDRAAKLFLEALKRDPGNSGYLRGLKEAGGQLPDQATVKPAPTEDDDAAMNARAKALLADGKFSAAIEAFKRVIARRPTDVEAMTLLGQAHLKAGQEKEAIDAYRKAYDMRCWSTTDYGARYALIDLLLKTGADDELVAVHEASRDFSAIRELYRKRNQSGKFIDYLTARLKKHQGDFELRFWLAEEHLHAGAPDKARAVFEQLRSELVAGAPVNRQRLSDGFDRLGDPAMALELLDVHDYSETPDPQDWLGTRLMRLQAKTHQMSDALNTCLIRLRNDPDGYRTLQIATEIVAYSSENKSVPLLNDWLKGLEGKIPEKVSQRFIGAVGARLRTVAPTAGPKEQPAERKDPVAALKQGRIVPVPSKAETLLDYLNALAASTHTAVDQSFQDTTRKLPAPKVKRAEAPAMELLAEALNGLPVSLEVNQQGFWALSERGDPSSKGFYAASGGLLLHLNNYDFVRRRGALVAMGSVFVDPDVMPDVVAFEMCPKVDQAVDDAGRQLQGGPGSGPWTSVGRLTIFLREQAGKAKAVSALTLTVRVAVCTKWITLKSAMLDATEPIVMKDQSATVTVGPLRTGKPEGDEPWHLPVVVEWKESSDKIGEARLSTRMYFQKADGTRLPVSGMSSSGTTGNRVYDLRVARGAFPPDQTGLVVLLPGATEVVPVELKLKDVPIRDPR